METFKAVYTNIGYHPEGYRIDKTASAINRYTQWDISPDDKWNNPKPVCFHSLPEDGWFKVNGFNWDD